MPELATFTILWGIPNLIQVHNKMWHLTTPSPRTESHHLMTLMTSPQVTRAEREWVKPDRSIASPPLHQLQTAHAPCLPPCSPSSSFSRSLEPSIWDIHLFLILDPLLHATKPPLLLLLHYFILRSRFAEICSCRS